MKTEKIRLLSYTQILSNKGVKMKKEAWETIGYILLLGVFILGFTASIVVTNHTSTLAAAVGLIVSLIIIGIITKITKEKIISYLSSL